MQRHISQILTAIIVAAISVGCHHERPPMLNPAAEHPPIYPDYIDVTIPAEIAPMNFNLADSIDISKIYVKVTGTNGGQIECTGGWADFDIDDWHRLTELNRGADLTFDVYAKRPTGEWLRYKPFNMHVSQYALTDFGVTYRKIAPGFETFSKIGIYQRELSTYVETPILEETAVQGQCLNCHYANRANPEQYTIHVRGAKGGTIVNTPDGVKYLNTKTNATEGSCTYGYWHPEGRYCAYSLNRIYQNFYVGADKFVEPWDYFSDLVVLDTQTDELILTPLLLTEDYQTTPAFSADGTTIYYCYSPKRNMPAEYAQLKYSLCAIGFDADKGTYGERIDTIIDADSIGRSVSMPRPSYDGRYLMYNLTDYGTTPVDHSDADIWIMDLCTGESREMTEINSEYADGYHNWSSDSRWVVFGSRRDDHLYSWLYLTCIDDSGHGTKPFVMPQRNPKRYYMEALHSFNAPDFTTVKVGLDPIAVHALVASGETRQVSVKH